MTVRRLTITAAIATVAAIAAVPASASAASVGILGPAGVVVEKPVDVKYQGVADAPGTAVLHGVGPNMMLRVYYERDGKTCEPTSAAEKAKPNVKLDGTQWIESSNEAPQSFDLTSKVVFNDPGAYRFCAYLEVGLTAENEPPAAFSEAVINVARKPIPCTVPKMTNLTLATATKKLIDNGCSLGKVSKPKRSAKKKLVVRSQSVEPQVVLATGSKINLVLKVKGAKTKKKTKKK